MAVTVIQRGDLLITADGRNYFIRDLEKRSFRFGSTPSMRYMATVSVNVWRNPDVDEQGRRGDPVLVLSNVKCTPIDATRGELDASALSGGMPAETLITFIDGGDVFYRCLLDQRESEM